jgi:AcrR family transcriptional regulator
MSSTFSTADADIANARLWQLGWTLGTQIMKTDKKAEILNQAAHIMARHGYAAASISAIAAAVGLSKAAIFHHFDTKEDIYIAIVIDVLRDMCTSVSKFVDTRNDPETKLRAFMHGHADYFEKHPEMITATHFGFEDVRTMEKRSEITNWRDRYERILRDILLEGQSWKSFSTFDTAKVGRMVLAVLNDMPRWYRPDGHMSATQFADLYCDILLSGIRNYD